MFVRMAAFEVGAGAAKRKLTCGSVTVVRFNKFVRSYGSVRYRKSPIIPRTCSKKSVSEALYIY